MRKEYRVLSGTSERLSLPNRLKQHDTTGNRRIQRGYAPLYRDSDQQIAFLPDQRADSLPLTTNHKDHMAGKVLTVQGCGGVTGGAIDPESLPLQLLQGLGDVGDPDHRDRLDGAGGGL